MNETSIKPFVHKADLASMTSYGWNMNDGLVLALTRNQQYDPSISRSFHSSLLLVLRHDKNDYNILNLVGWNYVN